MSIPMIPIIDIKVEGLKSTLRSHFDMEHDGLMEMLDQEIEKALSSEAIRAYCKKVAEEEIQKAMQEKMREFFRWGAGGDHLSEQIKKSFSLEVRGKK